MGALECRLFTSPRGILPGVTGLGGVFQAAGDEESADGRSLPLPVSFPDGDRRQAAG
ncbi:MAG: hypothetical protein K6T80_02365 [Firmicutes bacterium]|nr:hypothetical protein [Bacillota bacterium]